MKKKKKALLFDFDGTLINSQPIINNYLESIFAFKHLHISEHEKKMLGGMSFPTMRAYLAKKKGIRFSRIERFAYNIWFLMSHLRDIRKFDHVDEMLQHFKEQGYVMGIVSNSPRSYLNYIMRKEKIKKYFDVTICVTESKVPKPAPTMMIMAADLLGYEYKDCVVIDDNEPGITAAKALGMTAVRVDRKDIKTKADFTISDITKLPSVINKR